jgi:hypothetical protein
VDKEFLRSFFERLDKMKEEDRTLSRCLAAIEAKRLSTEGLSDEEELMCKRAIKMALLQGKIKR